MPEAAAGTPAAGTYIGLDFGLRRIGVAVGQTTTGTARPLSVVKHAKQPDWAELERIFGQWRPRALVVGLPLNSDGKETPLSGRARGFGRELSRRFSYPVHYNDERLTSNAARSRFVQQRASGTARRRDAAKLDAMAAAIILETWFADCGI